MHTRRTHDRTHVHTHAYHDWQDREQRHAAARRGTEMERRRHSLAHTRALSHEPFHASTAHPSPPIPIITSTSATPPRIYARTHARTHASHTQDVHTVFTIKTIMKPKTLPTELLGRVCLYPQNVQRGFHTIIPSEDQGNRGRAQGPLPLNQSDVPKGSPGCKQTCSSGDHQGTAHRNPLQSKQGSYTGQHEVQG